VVAVVDPSGAVTEFTASVIPADLVQLVVEVSIEYEWLKRFLRSLPT
jgi:hypothetical protein